MTEQASPHRRLAPGRLVLASHNRGKLAEMAELLAPYGIEMVAASDLGLPEPEETGDSFRANAELKARAAAQGSGLPALADDSGLEVAALDGAPGIHSARWAGADKNFAAVFDRLQAAVVERGDESARFFCALALAWPDGHCEHFEGTIDGKLVFPARGTHGFGYDPIFVPEGDVRCFAEMSAEEKHRLSHRARAVARLVDACLSPPK